jgi:SAV_6107-like HEPN
MLVETQSVRVLPPSSRLMTTRIDRTEMPSVPAHAFPHRSASQLLALARRGLDDAADQPVDGLRYATAHLAGLRAAAAVVAARAKPVPSPRSKLTSVWDLLAIVAPALGEWAAYFAASASKRVAAEAGIPRVVSARDADDLVQAAATFIAIVERALGHLAMPALLDDLVA